MKSSFLYFLLFGLIASCGYRDPVAPYSLNNDGNVSYDRYEDGDVTRVDSKSNKRKQRSTNNLVICPMCNGTGIFDYMPGDIKAPKVVCPCCQGSGMCTSDQAANNNKMRQDVDRMFGNYSNNSDYNAYNFENERNRNNSLQCPICYGSGKCDMCAGRGERRYHNSYLGGDGIMDCSTCRGTGRCQTCYGKGTI